MLKETNLVLNLKKKSAADSSLVGRLMTGPRRTEHRRLVGQEPGQPGGRGREGRGEAISVIELFRLTTPTVGYAVLTPFPP